MHVSTLHIITMDTCNVDTVNEKRQFVKGCCKGKLECSLYKITSHTRAHLTDFSCTSKTRPKTCNTLPSKSTLYIEGKIITLSQLNPNHVSTNQPTNLSYTRKEHPNHAPPHLFPFSITTLHRTIFHTPIHFFLLITNHMYTSCSLRCRPKPSNGATLSTL